MMVPYGSWPSPIPARMVAAQGLRLGSVILDGDDVYWLEGRPDEGGRTVLVRRTADGRIEDLTPAPFNVRTRVHEYGGGACVVSRGSAWFSNFADQRLYHVRADAAAVPRPITPEGRWCFADAAIDASRSRLVCVREDHSRDGVEPTTTLVAIPTYGDMAGPGTVLVSGDDFYSNPRVSPDGRWLSWLSWRHPRMPWDGTELWAGEISRDGSVSGPLRIAGGDTESIYQPGWLPDGSLCFASDRTGWWRLYRWTPGEAAVRAVLQNSAAGSAPGESDLTAHDRPGAEFGRPQWVFGSATWAAAGRNRLVVSCTVGGRWHLGTIDLAEGTLRELAPGLSPLEWLAATDTHAVLVAASPLQPEAVVRVDLQSGQVETLRSAAVGPAIDPATISVAEPVTFPTSDGRAHAFFYAPRNGTCAAAPGERPPLIVIGHGGPTTATRDTLDLKVQFWTSRGFAVVDVNYRGSSGYGREYRDRLKGAWGVADVEDMINVTRFLVAEGRADPRRLIIRGGSAGGYTALAVLTFHPGVFGAGASYYGICDLEVLARDTHKFEARYLDSLIGPYPAMRDTYRARSPIHFVDRLASALILFQGLEDKVVPPNQSELMAEAVRRKGLPVAYVAFEGEQHGFRKADTIVQSLEAELAFYGAVFGFRVADSITPPRIENL